MSAVVANAGLTEGEKEEGAKAKEALNEDGEGSEDEGDTRKAATYGNKKNEVWSCCGFTPASSSCSAWQVKCFCDSHPDAPSSPPPSFLHFTGHAAHNMLIVHSVHCILFPQRLLQCIMQDYMLHSICAHMDACVLTS